MFGYGYAILFRFTPSAGLVETLDTRDAFADLRGQAATVVEYREELDRRVDVNMARRNVVYGFRPRVNVSFTVVTTEDQQYFAQIASRLASSSYTSEISLDGGVTWRVCVLESIAGPVPLGGKPYAGASYSVVVDCRDLLSEYPVQMTATGVPTTASERMQNGSFVTWTDPAGSPDGWTANDSAGGVAVDRGSGASYDGDYWAKISRPSSATNFVGIGQYRTGLVPGATYRFVFAHKPSATGIGNTVKASITNTTRGEYLASDGVTWSTSAAAIWDQAPTAQQANVWTLRERTIRVSPRFQAGDQYLVQFAPYFSVGNWVGYDGVSLFGPIWPTGVAKW